MTQRSGTIVYIAHSGRSYRDEARFSILTLLARLKPGAAVAIALYTDQPSAAVDHARVRVIPITRADVFRWAGPHSYIHRCKLEILRRAVDDVGLPFIFIDTDTQWHDFPPSAFERLTTLPQTDGKQSFYMWRCYGPLSKYPEYFRLADKNPDVLGQLGLDAHPAYDMWNSGVIGVPPAAASIFGDCLELTDRLCGRLERRKHIRCVEQVAVSLVAQNRFHIAPFFEHVDHYYRYSHIGKFVLRDWLARLPDTLGVEEQAKLSAEHLLTDARVFGSRYITRWSGRTVARVGRSWKNKSSRARSLWMQVQRKVRAP